MADFINTLDVLGDDVVMDSIIDRTITEFKDDAITELGARAFNGCTALTEVVLPELTMESNKNTATSIFSGCSNLRIAEMPKLMYIRNAMFSGCKSLVSFSAPFAVLGSDVNPGMGAFQNCSSLASIDLAALPVVPMYCFMNTALTAADFPNATKINNYAFMNAPLKALVLRNTATMCTLVTVGYTFDGTPIKSGTGYIYVPRALLSEYQAATNWSTYAAQFRALEDYTVDGTVTGELDETKI